METKLLDGSALMTHVEHTREASEIRLVHTLASFLASRETFLTVSEGADRMGECPSMFEGYDSDVRMSVYDGSLFALERDALDAWTIVERDEWTGTRDFVGMMLYFDWYVWEMVGAKAWTCEMLTRLLDDFAEVNGYAPMCARELQFEINEDPAAHDRKGGMTAAYCWQWLEHFCEVWEERAEEEDRLRQFEVPTVGARYYIINCGAGGEFFVEGLATVCRSPKGEDVDDGRHLVEFENGERVLRFVHAELHEEHGREEAETFCDGINSRA